MEEIGNLTRYLVFWRRSSRTSHIHTPLPIPNPSSIAINDVVVERHELFIAATNDQESSFTMRTLLFVVEELDKERVMNHR